MRRQAPTVAVKPSMLLHFAVITVIVTGCIAMFATGENAKFAKAPFDERMAINRTLSAEKQSGKTRTVGGMILANGTKVNNGGGESEGPFTDSNSGGTRGHHVASGPGSDSETNSINELPSSFGRLPGEPGGPPKPGQPPIAAKLTTNQIAKILAASRARSSGPAANEK
jgi:hypothetical protein